MLDWLQNHGEVFLRKNVGIGRNLQKAKAYQKSHETFEGVVQVSTCSCLVTEILSLLEDPRDTSLLTLYLQIIVHLTLQNTYTNAEKLLAAAAELAQTGECNADDIYSVAHQLGNIFFSNTYQRIFLNLFNPNFRVAHIEFREQSRAAA